MFFVIGLTFEKKVLFYFLNEIKFYICPLPIVLILGVRVQQSFKMFIRPSIKV